MKIGLYWPAYNRRLMPEVAMMALREQKWCIENGHELVPYWFNIASIPAAFNRGIEEAYSLGCDLLFFNTTDCFSPEFEVLKQLIADLEEHDASSVGIPCLTRTVNINTQVPCTPNTIYEGVVANTLMLLDLRKLIDLPMPWFVDVMNADGTSRKISQDIYFAEHMRDHGHKCMVEFRIPSVNLGEMYFSTQEILDNADRVKIVGPDE